jgi:sporulation protein YabP
VIFLEEKQIQKVHKLVLNNRKTSVMTGVLDVLAFDLNEILLETEQGMLMIKGKDLHVNRLSLEKGEVDVTGHIDSCTYSDMQPNKKKEESFLVRLFK